MSKTEIENAGTPAAGESRGGDAPAILADSGARPAIAHNVYSENRHKTRPPWAPPHVSDDVAFQVDDLISAETALDNWRMGGLRSADSREFVGAVHRFRALLHEAHSHGYEEGRDDTAGGFWTGLCIGAGSTAVLAIAILFAVLP